MLDGPDDYRGYCICREQLILLPSNLPGLQVSSGRSLTSDYWRDLLV
jgi:hypothetical protein